MNTWWATEKAKEALQTGYGLEDVRCTGQRLVHDGSETNLCVDLIGNITDGPWGAIVGAIDLHTGLVRNEFGKQTGTIALGAPAESSEMRGHRIAG